MAMGDWNPLRCAGTALPVPLLLAVKLIAVALLLTGHARLLPEPFLPFIPALARSTPGRSLARMQPDEQQPQHGA